MNKKVYVIILNYNGWLDTIPCVESVLKSHYDNYTVVICDNASTNNSVEKIKAWLAGELLTSDIETEKVAEIITNNIYPEVKKPLAYSEYTSADIENKCITADDKKIVLIKSDKNRGFSGGNNLGLKYMLSKNDGDYAWILNNDTVVDKNAIGELVKKMETQKCICSSIVCDYYRPNIVQSLGGKWRKIALKTGSVGRNIEYTKIQPNMPMDMYQGASFMISKGMIDEIGLLDETYFLYFEEISLSAKAKRKSYLPVYAEKAIVYHKGSNSTTRIPSANKEYHFSRSRTIYVLREEMPYMPILIYKIAEQIFKHLLQGNMEIAKAILKGAKDGIRQY